MTLRNIISKEIHTLMELCLSVETDDVVDNIEFLVSKKMEILEKIDIALENERMKYIRLGKD